MRLIDADKLLKGIAELKQSPWFNSKYGYADRKEAVEIIEDLCIKEAPTVDAVYGVGRYEKAMQKLREMPRCLNGVKAKQIKKLPSDVVEVVRCKDCKHWKGNDEPIPWNDGNIFIKVPCETKPMDFCSMGKRKEEG